MAKLKPWFKVVAPREDLREGRPLDAAEFAVHLDQVRDGRATADYQNPEHFFDRTYLTKNLLAVSAEIVRHTLGEREDQEAFALEELTRALEEDPRVAERVAAYSRKIVGEGLTQTARALGESALLRELLAAAEGERRWVLDLLDGHRARLDRLGIERVEADSFD